MGQAIDEAGNVWETDAQGNGVRIITPATQQGRVFSLPPNPKEVRQEARQDAAAARAERNADRSASASERQAAVAEKSISNQSFDNQRQMKSDFDALPTTKEYRVAISQLATGLKTAPDATGDNALIYAYAKAMDPGSVVRESEMGMAASGASVIEATAANLKKQLGIEGGGQLNQVVRDRMRREMLNKVGELNRVYSSQRQRFVDDANANGFDPIRIVGNHDGDAFLPVVQEYNRAHQRADNEVPDPSTGADLKPPPAPDDSGLPPANAGGNFAPTDGSSRIVRDPRVAAQMDAMINAGAGEATINAMLKRQNFPTVRSGDLIAAKKWMRENPGKSYYGSDPTRAEDLNFGQRVLANPAVAPLAAGAAQYANAATAGAVGAMAGEQGQGALDAAAALHPTASTVGSLAGGVTGALGAEAALAARAPAALVQYAPRVADALYGGLYGFNTAQEGQGGMGALKGAGAGLAGSYLGTGAGKVMRGIRNPSVDYLRGQGIPLTVGQTVGNGGLVGQGVKKIEDALTSVPFVGNMVEARRMEGLNAFDQAAFNKGALGQGAVNRLGSEGVDDLRAIKDRAYSDALDPVQIDPTAPQLGADLNAARGYAQANIPDEIDQARTAALAALDSRVTAAVDPATGMIPGRNFQEAYRGLARTGRERANRDYGHEIGQTMRQGQDALAGAVEEQFPGSFPAFLQANAINRNLNTLSDAVKNSHGNAGVFTPSQLGRADIGSTSKLQGKIEAAGTNRPFYDLSSAGQAVLPSKVPDSGTWTRALVGGGGIGALGGVGGYLGGTEGAATGTGGGLLLTAALAAGGSKAAQKAMVKILADRPDALARLGDQFVTHGGWAGSGALTPLLVGP